jgi:hypothetical protein
MAFERVDSSAAPGGTGAVADGGCASLELRHGRLLDRSRDEFPTIVSGWCEGALMLEDGGTHFGYVYSGRPVVETTAGEFALRPGMYFSLPGAGAVRGEGAGIVASRLGYRGMFTLGGPVEPTGRLRYIDGCTDSVLLPPVMLGDPCLNALYFRPGTLQTAHSHPSTRVGIVISGGGECITLQGSVPLLPGRVFVLEPGAVHRFKTADSPMTVVVYHPDSDFGPTDEAHPMINRTLIDGVAAGKGGAAGSAGGQARG